jgi:hypothetical protein
MAASLTGLALSDSRGDSMKSDTPQAELLRRVMIKRDSLCVHSGIIALLMDWRL